MVVMLMGQFGPLVNTTIILSALLILHLYRNVADLVML